MKLGASSWIEYMNELGSKKEAFLFILDFELKKPLIFTLDKLPTNIYYKLNNITNHQKSNTFYKPLTFEITPQNIEVFTRAFDNVQREINHGNSFLLNLTFSSAITTNYTLKDIFQVSNAKYKLYYDDQFVVASPETFVRINNNKIFTFPMKGTIDASIPDAKNIILHDMKEVCEHNTIVDLLRNDLSQVGHKVKVNKFRYIDTITTNNKNLLQVSSEIEATLPTGYASQLGTIFSKLLPAGSISGAPKKKTLEIIKTNELDNRGYYTGIFGIFDGENVDSGVMIRYFEQNDNQLLYRSGCGITHMSEVNAEYKEMIDKIYVPFN